MTGSLKCPLGCWGSVILIFSERWWSFSLILYLGNCFLTILGIIFELSCLNLFHFPSRLLFTFPLQSDASSIILCFWFPFFNLHSNFVLERRAMGWKHSHIADFFTGRKQWPSGAIDGAHLGWIKNVFSWDSWGHFNRLALSDVRQTFAPNFKWQHWKRAGNFFKGQKHS